MTILQARMLSSIRKRLLFLLLVIFVPLYAIQLVLYEERLRSLRQEEVRTNQDIASATSDGFQSFILGVLHQEHLIGRTYLMHREEMNQQRMNEILDSSVLENPALWDNCWVSPEGKVLAASKRSSIGRDLRDEPVIERIVKGENWVVGDLVKEGESGEDVVFPVSRAIRNELGELQGIVMAVIDPSRLSSAMTLERTRGGAVQILDGSGNLVFRYPMLDMSWSQRRFLRDEFVQMKESEDSYGMSVSETGLDGEDRLFVFVPIQPLGWASVASRPVEEVLGPAVHHANRNTLLYLVITTVGLVTTLAVSRSITTPITRLREHALNMGTREAPPKLDQTGPIEIRDLANALVTAERELLLRRKKMEEYAHELYETMKQAEESNKAKSEFLANMSHEIRTPISGIMGLTEMLLSRELPAEIRTDLVMVKDSAASLLHIINDLLDLSRIETGKMEINPVNFDLPARLRNWLQPFELQARDKSLTFETHIGSDVPRFVIGDPDRLGQVVKNLVANAVKFTEQGRVLVSMEHGRVRDDLHTILLKIRDTGIGIPKEKQQNLFKNFSQIDSSFSKKFEGAGLGLAISKQLAELMGGSIEVESEHGLGSVFTFRVVLRQGYQPDPPKPASEPVSLPGLTILLAEDNVVNKTFMARHLRDLGHSVLMAENGLEVLRTLKMNPCDIILMDVQMPEMDGVETTKRIRRAGPGTVDPDIPIIALTAYAMKGDRERFLAAGMNGYVTKPVDFDLLNRTMAEVLQRAD